MKYILGFVIVSALSSIANAQIGIGASHAPVVPDNEILSQQKKHISSVCNHLLPQMINIETMNPTGAIKEMRALKEALSEAQRINVKMGSRIDLTVAPRNKPDAPFKGIARSVFTTPDQYNEFYWLCEQAKEP